MKTDHDGVASRLKAAGVMSTQTTKRRSMLRTVSDNSIALVPDAPQSAFMEIGARFAEIFREYLDAKAEIHRRRAELHKAIDDSCPPELIMTANDRLMYQFAEVPMDELNDVIGKPLLFSLDLLDTAANLGNMSPAMRARRLELLAARTRWYREIRKAERRIGFSEIYDCRIEKAFQKLTRAIDHIVERASHLEAKTPAECAVKAQMALWTSKTKDADAEISNADGQSRILWSLIRDLINQSQIYTNQVAKTHRGSQIPAMA
jgi:hypothetical protein